MNVRMLSNHIQFLYKTYSIFPKNNSFKSEIMINYFNNASKPYRQTKTGNIRGVSIRVPDYNTPIHGEIPCKLV